MALIHRWPLTENANDVVGGLNLTNNGAVTFSSEGGYFTTGKWLNGTKQFPDSGSISAWIKVLNFTTLNSIVVVTDSTDSYSHGVDINGSLRCMWNQNTIGSSFINNNEYFPSNAYVFVTVTSERINSTTYMKAYRNATIGGEGSGSVYVKNLNFSIGRWGSYNGHYFNGYILDVSIFDHAISQFEILSLYLAGPNGVVGGNPPRPSVSTPVILSTMPTALTRGFR